MAEPENAKLTAAKQRLARAINAQQTNPAELAIAGYINSTIQSVRVAAIVEYLTSEPTDTELTPKERLEAILIANFESIADQIEKHALKSSLLRPGRINGDA